MANYTIHYECRAEHGTYQGQIVIDCESYPVTNDPHVIHAALRDSVKFHMVGMAGIKIISISENKSRFE